MMFAQHVAVLLDMDVPNQNHVIVKMKKKQKKNNYAFISEKPFHPPIF